MADLWMDVDVALAEVPITLLPLLDDTDFKTREESVVFNQAGLDLVWNFVTTAGAMTQTAVTPTDTAGDYDWVSQGNGLYTIEMPASGGASINNDTEGFGWFTGFATGVLPWRGPVIGFRAAGLNNVLIDDAFSATRGLAGTALPDAVADAATGLPISDAGGLDLDAKLANTNEVTAARMAALTDWINGGRLDLLLDAIPTTAMRGTDNASTHSAADVWAVDATGQQTGGTFGQAIGDPGANTETMYDAVVTDAAGTNVAADIIAIEGQTDDIGVAGAGLSNIPWNASWDAEVQSEVDDALIAKGLDHLVFTSVTGTDIADNSIIAKMVDDAATADWDGYDNTTASLEALNVDTDAVISDLANGTDGLGALKALIDTVNTDLSNGTDGLGALKTLIDALNDITAASVMTTQMTESYAADGTAPTPAQALHLILAVLTEFAISGTTLTAKKLDGIATAATFTLDDATNPTSLTRAT